MERGNSIIGRCVSSCGAFISRSREYDQEVIDSFCAVINHCHPSVHNSYIESIKHLFTYLNSFVLMDSTSIKLNTEYFCEFISGVKKDLVDIINSAGVLRALNRISDGFDYKHAQLIVDIFKGKNITTINKILHNIGIKNNIKHLTMVVQQLKYNSIQVENQFGLGAEEYICSYDAIPHEYLQLFVDCCDGKFDSLRFSVSCWEKIDFTNCRFHNTIFVNEFKLCNFSKSRFSSCKFNFCNLDGCQFIDCDLSSCGFSEVDFKDCNLSKSTLNALGMFNIDLSNVELSGVRWRFYRSGERDNRYIFNRALDFRQNINDIQQQYVYLESLLSVMNKDPIENPAFLFDYIDSYVVYKYIVNIQLPKILSGVEYNNNEIGRGNHLTKFSNCLFRLRDYHLDSEMYKFFVEHKDSLFKLVGVLKNINQPSYDRYGNLDTSISELTLDSEYVTIGMFVTINSIFYQSQLVLMATNSTLFMGLIPDMAKKIVETLILETLQDIGILKYNLG